LWEGARLYTNHDLINCRGTKPVGLPFHAPLCTACSPVASMFLFLFYCHPCAKVSVLFRPPSFLRHLFPPPLLFSSVVGPFFVLYLGRTPIFSRFIRIIRFWPQDLQALSPLSFLGICNKRFIPVAGFHARRFPEFSLVPKFPQPTSRSVNSNKFEVKFGKELYTDPPSLTKLFTFFICFNSMSVKVCFSSLPFPAMFLPLFLLC